MMRSATSESSHAHSRVDRYAAFSQTETCVVLSLVKGSRFQSFQRSRKVIPAVAP